MGSLSRLSSKCRSCPFVSKCNHKKMEFEAYIEPNILQEVRSPVVEEMVQPMLIKHDYRDIKVGENTTITIDVEELKRQMKKDFYRNLGIGFYPGA